MSGKPQPDNMEFDADTEPEVMDNSIDENENSRELENVVEMDAASASGPPRPRPNFDPEDCWDSVADQFQRCCVTARKRKFDVINIVDSEDEVDYVEPNDASDSDPFESENKKLNVNPELQTKAFQILGTNRLLLEKLFRYFTNNEIRSMTLVTRLFRRVGKAKLRQRYGNHPFVLLWKSQSDFKRFLLRTFLYEAECGPEPVQALFLAATTSLQDSSLLTTPPTQLLKGVSCLLGLSRGLILTTPDLLSTFEIQDSSSEHACQALCIPRSNNLHIRGFTAVDRSVNDMKRLYETLALPAPNCMALKGIILLFYQDEPELSRVIADRINREPQPATLVGGELEFVRTSENDSRDELACGWALFGNEHLRVASYALEIDGIPDFEELYAQMRQHFQGSENGLVFVFYSSKTSRSSDIIEKIRQHVRDGIPVIGFQVLIDSLCFQGFLPRLNPNYMFFTNGDAALKNIVKMVAMFVAY